MTRKIIVLFIMMAAVALILSGCGGGDEGTADGGNGEGSATGSEQEEAGEGEAESVAAGDPEAGEQLFVQSCSACHGTDAKGLPNLGKDLTESEFIHSNSDEELLTFVKVGRPVSDPDNTTGIDMPPKGGNPALTDEQILDIIAYLRTLEE